MIKILKIASLVLLTAILVGTTGFVIWGLTPQAAMPEATAALTSTSQVRVETSAWFTFRPTKSQPTSGLVIYPGGHVDPRAYAPTARAIAEQGYLVVITPMPLALAFFNSDAGADVMRANPDIKHWAIAGHSLGGVAAASFAMSNTRVQGLALWASYPADWDSLANSNLQVFSIYGSRDGLSTSGKVNASLKLLPGDTRLIQIEGGNHGQFGWYGIQSGDGTATISREEQQKQIVDATVELLEEISAK